MANDSFADCDSYQHDLRKYRTNSAAKHHELNVSCTQEECCEQNWSFCCIENHQPYSFWENLLGKEKSDESCRVRCVVSDNYFCCDQQLDKVRIALIIASVVFLFLIIGVCVGYKCFHKKGNTESPLVKPYPVTAVSASQYVILNPAPVTSSLYTYSLDPTEARAPMMTPATYRPPETEVYYPVPHDDIPAETYRPPETEVYYHMPHDTIPGETYRPPETEVYYPVPPDPANAQPSTSPSAPPMTNPNYIHY